MGRKSSVVVAIVVAFVLLGGGAFAASSFVITNIHQIKPSVVKNLRGVTTIRRSSSSASYCASAGGACAVASATATCPSGTRTVGGSASATSIETSISTFAGLYTYGAVSDNSSPFSGTLTVTVLCATGPGGVTAFGTRRAATENPAAQTAARLRSQLNTR